MTFFFLEICVLSVAHHVPENNFVNFYNVKVTKIILFSLSLVRGPYGDCD
jgi:hypothetical protein